MYNLKITEFPSGVTRVQIYGYEIEEDYQRPECNEPETEINPFDGRPTRVYREFPEPDLDRSLYESMRRTKSKVYDYSLANSWDWFVTLTFSPEKVDRYDYDSCVNALKHFLIVCRRKCPDLHYIFVPERHKDGAFHFHGLLASCEGLEFVPSGVQQNGKDVYNISGYKLGFSTATMVKDSFKAGGYVCKYITKDLCQVSKGRKRYWASRNLQMPARIKMTVDFAGKRDMMLDTLFDSASYYKELNSSDGDRTSWFYEFPADCGLDFSQFERFRYEGG